MRDRDHFDDVAGEHAEEQYEREASKLRTANGWDAWQNTKRERPRYDALHGCIDRSNELIAEASLAPAYHSRA